MKNQIHNLVCSVLAILLLLFIVVVAIFAKAIQTLARVATALKGKKKPAPGVQPITIIRNGVSSQGRESVQDKNGNTIHEDLNSLSKTRIARPGAGKRLVKFIIKKGEPVNC